MDYGKLLNYTDFNTLGPSTSHNQCMLNSGIGQSKKRILEWLLCCTVFTLNLNAEFRPICLNDSSIFLGSCKINPRYGLRSAVGKNILEKWVITEGRRAWATTGYKVNSWSVKLTSAVGRQASASITNEAGRTATLQPSTSDSISSRYRVKKVGKHKLKRAKIQTDSNVVCIFEG